MEYNVRFGDPETQVIMQLLKSDLLSLLEACCEGSLGNTRIKWSNDTAVCVVMAAPGYPESYAKGIEIKLPQGTEAASEYQVIFHDGTVFVGDKLLSAGGIVLNVMGRGSSLRSARERAYELIRKIDFPNAHFRTDIGVKGLTE